MGARGTQHTFGCRITSARSLLTTDAFPNPSTSYSSADKVLPAPKPREKLATEKSESPQEKVSQLLQFLVLLQNLVFWIWIIYAQRHFKTKQNKTKKPHHVAYGDSLTRDRTWDPAWKCQVLTTGLSGNFPGVQYF